MIALQNQRRGARMCAGLYDDLIVDLFAGGGGASVGIEAAMGRSVDVAVNHDPIAVAMHRVNHPYTRHLISDVFEVDPLQATCGRRVGLLWASPDCTYHSKARGAKPIRSRQAKRRALAWVVVRWASIVRPAVIMLENVEEFADWCPLVPQRDDRGALRRDADGAVLMRPCQHRKGETFRRWVRELRALGYAVEWRELRACDYGSPTIRKRLYVIARCDGQPIIWPEKSHGVEDSGAARRRVVRRRGEIRNEGTGEGMASVRETVLDGHADSCRPLPRRYRTAAECIDWSLACPSIFLTREEARAIGLKVQRPLKPATMRRIARGVKKYVLDAAKPFVVLCNHSGDLFRGHGVDEPMSTVTCSRDARGVVVPFVAGVGGRQWQSMERGVDRPLQTITAKADSVVVAPFAIPRYGERDGQAPRCGSVDRPAPTIVPNGNGAQLVASFLAQHNGGMVGHAADRPLSTISSKGAQQQVVACHVVTNTSGHAGASSDAPLPTVTTGGHHGVVAACLSQQRGSATAGGPGDAARPLPTITAGGNHAALVYAFLASYYGVGIGQDVRDPMRTIPTHERFAVVMVDGTPRVIVDIGMRMLTPRELYRCQGFEDGYVIDIVHDGKPLTKGEQTRLVGNSVCPQVAEALVRANMPLCGNAATNRSAGRRKAVAHA